MVYSSGRLKKSRNDKGKAVTPSSLSLHGLAAALSFTPQTLMNLKSLLAGMNIFHGECLQIHMPESDVEQVKAQQ